MNEGGCSDCLKRKLFIAGERIQCSLQTYGMIMFCCFYLIPLRILFNSFMYFNVGTGQLAKMLLTLIENLQFIYLSNKINLTVSFKRNTKVLKKHLKICNHKRRILILKETLKSKLLFRMGRHQYAQEI